MNPFRDTIVTNPWEATRVDVPAIHSRVFEECLRGVDHVRRSRRSAALLIHGEAGSGKTHLLSRLRSRLTPQTPAATDREECLYVWVRLQTSPRMIWRTLRRTLVDDWFRPIDGCRSQFDRILFHRLAGIRTAEGDLEPWYEYLLQEAPEGLRQLMGQIADQLDLDRNTAVAFEHIAFGRHRRDLRAWLSGASLPEPALQRMDLAQDEGTDEEREDQSRQVVLMLCRLAGNGLPIVLCFDQVEALQTTPGDRQALFAFGQLASTLHDGATNVLMVSCVQSSFATELKDQVRQADYDRMTSLGAYSLDPLSRAQAEHLIAARLAADGSGSPPARRPACWPLDLAEFDDLFGKGFVSPRKLLSLCAARFELRTQPESDTPPRNAPSRGEAFDSFLADAWATRVARKLEENVPERTEETIRHGLPLLVPLIAPGARLVHDELLPDVSPVFEAPAGRVGLSLCTQPNMTSLAARLKRLKGQLAQQRLQRLVLVRESRVPVSPGAKAARQYLEELEQQGAVSVSPALEVLAALDVLRELLSDAKSGDLDCQGEAVSPQMVEDWLIAHLSDGLRDFADDVFGTRSPGGNLMPADSRDFAALNAVAGVSGAAGPLP
jgi:hypothetical protein